MPYRIERRSGSRPYKIVRKDTGEVVGSSVSKAKAAASIRARSMGEAGLRIDHRGRER